MQAREIVQKFDEKDLADVQVREVEEIVLARKAGDRRQKKE